MTALRMMNFDGVGLSHLTAMLINLCKFISLIPWAYNYVCVCAIILGTIIAKKQDCLFK